MKSKFVQFFSLFTSTSTLICCALPALLAVIAGGAAVGSLISVFPWLVPLSQHKIWIFIVAGSMILLSGFLTFRSQTKQVCDVDAGEKGCEVSDKFQKRMFILSASIYAFGVFFSYLLVPILRWIDSFGGTV